MTTISHRIRPAVAAGGLTMALICALLLTGCVGDPTGNGAANGDSGSSNNAAAGDLSPEARKTCEQIFSREASGTGPSLVAVIDRTASVAAEPLPADFGTALEEASIADGSLTVIAVDGAGAPPRIIAKHAALSTAGERDRPSVKKIAAVIPSCVDQVLLPQAKPTTEGTDLHRALALASEFSDAKSELWVQTDLLSTSGPFALNPATLALDPGDAAKRIAQQAPVDLHGAAAHFIGIGQASTPLYTADREWLRGLAQGLCAAWKATGCEGIKVEPVEPAAPAEGLPADPAPAFPTVSTTGVAGDCRFDVPASLTFAGGSAELRNDAAELLAAPLDLARHDENTRVEIIGHTASLAGATDAHQRSFSHERAKAVAGLFIAAGIPADRVTASGVGDSEPLAEHIDPKTGEQIEELAAAERRVELIIRGAACPAG